MAWRHPALVRPISFQRFLDEFARVWLRGPLRLTHGRRPKVVLDEELAQTHARNCRRYAWVDVPLREFHFAPQVLWLPAANRLGLLGHEVGHVIAGLRGDEDDADRASLEVFGISIGYDLRFPGKGLQTGRLIR